MLPGTQKGLLFVTDSSWTDDWVEIEDITRQSQTQNQTSSTILPSDGAGKLADTLGRVLSARPCCVHVAQILRSELCMCQRDLQTRFADPSEPWPSQTDVRDLLCQDVMASRLQVQICISIQNRTQETLHHLYRSAVFVDQNRTENCLHE